MAKSSRASSRKANNQRLKAKVFGPVEAAREERLAAKLLEIASQPKPVPEREMEDAAEKENPEGEQKSDDSEITPPHHQPRNTFSVDCLHRQGVVHTT